MSRALLLEAMIVVATTIAINGSGQSVILEFLAQGSAVNTQHRRGAALVALAVIEHFDEQRDLHLAQDDLVHVVGIAAIKIAQVTSYRLGNVFT